MYTNQKSSGKKPTYYESDAMLARLLQEEIDRSSSQSSKESKGDFNNLGKQQTYYESDEAFARLLQEQTDEDSFQSSKQPVKNFNHAESISVLEKSVDSMKIDSSRSSEKATRGLLILLQTIRERIGNDCDKIEREKRVYRSDIRVIITKEEQALIEKLLSHNPNVLQTDENGYCILVEINHWALAKGGLDTSLLDKAVACHNRSIGIQNDRLAQAFYSKLNDAWNKREGMLKEIKALLKAATSEELKALNYINPVDYQRNRKGYSAIQNLAINLSGSSRGKENTKYHEELIKIVELLISYGANPNIPQVFCDEGRSALHLVMYNLDTEAAESLLNAGANPYQRGCKYRLQAPAYHAITSNRATYSTVLPTSDDDCLKLMELLHARGIKLESQPAPGPHDWGNTTSETIKKRKNPQPDSRMVALLTENGLCFRNSSHSEQSFYSPRLSK